MESKSFFFFAWLIWQNTFTVDGKVDDVKWVWWEFGRTWSVFFLEKNLTLKKNGKTRQACFCLCKIDAFSKICRYKLLLKQLANRMAVSVKERRILTNCRL